MQEERFEEAVIAFGELGAYKDSASMVTLAKYNTAEAAMEAKDYETAITVWQELGEYKDSASRLALAEITLQKENEYSLAAVAMKSGDYESAAAMWQKLGDYRDAAEQYAICDVELEWEKFRSCMESESVDLSVAMTNLNNITMYSTDNAMQYLDEGYYELAKAYYEQNKPVMSQNCLNKISDLTQFEDGEKFAEDVRLLDIYRRAEVVADTGTQ